MNIVEELNWFTSRHRLLSETAMKYYQGARNGRERNDRRNWKKFNCKERFKFHTIRLGRSSLQTTRRKFHLHPSQTPCYLNYTVASFTGRNPDQSYNTFPTSILKEVHLSLAWSLLARQDNTHLILHQKVTVFLILKNTSTCTYIWRRTTYTEQNPH